MTLKKVAIAIALVIFLLGIRWLIWTLIWVEN